MLLILTSWSIPSPVDLLDLKKIQFIGIVDSEQRLASIQLRRGASAEDRRGKTWTDLIRLSEPRDLLRARACKLTWRAPAKLSVLFGTFITRTFLRIPKKRNLNASG